MFDPSHGWLVSRISNGAGCRADQGVRKQETVLLAVFALLVAHFINARASPEFISAGLISPTPYFTSASFHQYLADHAGLAMAGDQARIFERAA
jgi:hypothetical protein